MENNDDAPLKEVLLSALLVWLKTLFYFLVLPYKIWKAAAYRLAAMSGKAIVDANEEFPVYTYNKIAIDATIFIMPCLALIIAFFSAMSAYRGGFAIFIMVLIYAYLLIPAISFMKEVITMSLSVVNSLRQIAKNTEK